MKELRVSALIAVWLFPLCVNCAVGADAETDPLLPDPGGDATTTPILDGESRDHATEASPADAHAEAEADAPRPEIENVVRGPSATCFRFPGATPFAPEYGPGTLEYWDPQGTGWGPARTKFGTTASFQLPALPDGPANAMHIPKLGTKEAYRLRHGAPANGPYATDGWVSSYTIVFDVYYPPAVNGQWRALYQTNTANTDDGEFFVQNAIDGGVGINSVYEGSVTAGDWHRIAVVIMAAVSGGRMLKFIDGVFVGEQGSIDRRWSLNPEFLLFADDNAETAEAYIASILFMGEALTTDQVRALGRPTSRGACAPGAAP
jgi:hypothetical protein